MVVSLKPNLPDFVACFYIGRILQILTKHLLLDWGAQGEMGYEQNRIPAFMELMF